MGLNAQRTAYIISRIKNGTEEVAQYNDYNGTIYWYSNRDSATNFEDLELAKGIKKIKTRSLKSLNKTQFSNCINWTQKRLKLMKTVNVWQLKKLYNI